MIRHPAVRFVALALVFLPPGRADAQTLDEARGRLAPIEGRLTVAGLDSAVEVRRDRWGVPHIYARTTHDLFFAQGLVAAQDRLFQMEIWRRTGEGRLAEILGSEFVGRDRFARLLRYRGDMEAEWTSYAPDARSIIRSFVAGVNAWIEVVNRGDAPLPIEFTTLDFRPVPWDDTVPLQRLAALSMTGNALGEVERALLVRALGAERAALLLPPDPARPLDPAPGLALEGIGPETLADLAAAYGAPRLQRGEGSNNWVVSGARTASGRPLLANDPHRSLTNPSLRYLTHLVGPGWNVIGAGEPALPGIAAGHNDRVAFGFTIVGMDQQDVYVEEVRPCPGSVRPRVRCARTGSGWEPLTVVVDTIPVRGAAPRITRLEFSRHGPIVAEDSSRRRAFAIRFVGSEPGTAGYLAQLSLGRVTDWATFRDAAARWKLPTENLLYADVEGNIGWVAAGLAPVRSWSGLLPVPGDGRFEWSGFLDVDQLPQSYNPATGLIATANHNILPDGYPHQLAYEWDASYRARRLEDVLGRGRQLTVEDVVRLQQDVLSLPAQALVPQLLDAARRHGRGDGWALDALRGWDFTVRKESGAAALYEVWWRAFADRVYRHLAGEHAALLVGYWDVPTLVSLAQGDSAMTRAWGLSNRGVRDAMLLDALDGGLAELTTRLGPDRPTWRWGALHRSPFPHPVTRAFDLASPERDGDGYTVNSTWGANHLATGGASFRGIYDLADWDRSVATTTPGQSGQPGSRFYGDRLEPWAAGQYFPLVYSRDAVEGATVAVLWLVPNGQAGGQ